jgi:hypothetical protein
VPQIAEQAEAPPGKTLTQYYDEMVRASATRIADSFAAPINDADDEDDE